MLLSSVAGVILAAVLLLAGFLRSPLAPFLSLWSFVAESTTTLKGVWLLAYDRFSRESEQRRLAESVALERSAYQTLQNEITQLQSLLGRLPPDAGTTIMSGVLAVPPASVYDTLILDVGQKGGVRRGMVALAPPEWWPVGVVDIVTPQFSRVRLYSAPSTRLLARLGEAQTPILLTGKGGGVLAGQVPQEMAPEVGTVVWTSSLPLTPIGRVVRVEQTPANPKATVVARIAPNPFTIRRVLLTESVRMLPASWWREAAQSPVSTTTMPAAPTSNGQE